MYGQAFDEIIRQITINCAERGFLLVRVRDELRMTMQAYGSLYESSVAKGMRKALATEELKNRMQERVHYLREKCESLEKEVDDCQQEIVTIGKKDKMEAALAEMAF